MGNIQYDGMKIILDFIEYESGILLFPGNNTNLNIPYPKPTQVDMQNIQRRTREVC